MPAMREPSAVREAITETCAVAHETPAATSTKEMVYDEMRYTRRSLALTKTSTAAAVLALSAGAEKAAAVDARVSRVTPWPFTATYSERPPSAKEKPSASPPLPAAIAVHARAALEVGRAAAAGVKIAQAPGPLAFATATYSCPPFTWHSVGAAAPGQPAGMTASQSAQLAGV